MVLLCNISRPELVGRVHDALLEIAHCDAGFRMVPAANAALVVFEPKRAITFWSDRIREMANDPRPVVICPGDSNLVNPISASPVINTGGGATNSFGDGSSSIYVDVDDAFGQHYRVPAVGGGTTYFPFCMVLCHELAHAYHNLEGTFDRGTGAAAHDRNEVKARTDENVLRPQILCLPLRDVQDNTNPGLGVPSRGSLEYTTCIGKHDGWTCGCNIATAVLGSPVARQIVEFRRAKRTFERLTLASVPVLQPMMDSYALFSPVVAGDVLTDARLREAMLHCGVQPAVRLLEIVQAHVDARGDRVVVTEQVRRSVSQYLCELPDGAWRQISTAADAADEASRTLTTGGLGTRAFAELDMAGEVFGCVVSAVRANGAGTDGPAWILGGLALFLRQAAEMSTGGDAELLADAVGDWLARIPLPDIVTLEGPTALASELDQLCGTLFPRQRSRTLFERRVLARWPQLKWEASCV